MVDEMVGQIEDMLKVSDEPTVRVPEKEPAEPIEPTESIELVEPVEPTEPVEPIEPTEPIEPVEPVEPVESVEPIEPAVDLVQLQKDNEELRKRIDTLSASKPEPEPEPEPVPEPEPEPIALDEVDFIGEADMDDLIRDPKEFNTLLNKIYIQGVNTSRDHITEGVLRNIPEIVKNNVSTVIALRKESEDFYDTNKDLVPFKAVVATVFEETWAKDPDKKYTEVMEGVADEVRKRLELHKNAVNPKPSNTDDPPKLPRKKSQPRQSSKPPNVDPLLADIDKMNESINNF